MKTDQEINEAIAEKCGKPLPFHRSSERDIKEVFDGDWKLIPNYCHDLNAMHEAEKRVILKGSLEMISFWLDNLYRAEGLNPYVWRNAIGSGRTDPTPPCEMASIVNSNARQRAEAFCRTVGIPID